MKQIILTVGIIVLYFFTAVPMAATADFCDKFPNRCREKHYQGKHSVGHYQGKHVEGYPVKTDRERCWDRNKDGWMTPEEIKTMNDSGRPCP